MFSVVVVTAAVFRVDDKTGGIIGYIRDQPSLCETENVIVGSCYAVCYGELPVEVK